MFDFVMFIVVEVTMVLLAIYKLYEFVSECRKDKKNE